MSHAFRNWALIGFATLAQADTFAIGGSRSKSDRTSPSTLPSDVVTSGPERPRPANCSALLLSVLVVARIAMIVITVRTVGKLKNRPLGSTLSLGEAAA